MALAISLVSVDLQRIIGGPVFVKDEALKDHYDDMVGCQAQRGSYSFTCSSYPISGSPGVLLIISTCAQDELMCSWLLR